MYIPGIINAIAEYENISYEEAKKKFDDIWFSINKDNKELNKNK